MAMATESRTADRTRYVCQIVFWVVFWTWGTFGFLADDVFTPLKQMRSQLVLLLDAVVVAMACVVVRQRWALVVTAIFLAVSWILTCALNHLGTLFWLNGTRDFIGLILLYPIVTFILDEPGSRQRFLDSFDKQGLYFLIVQAFCIVVQAFIYGAGDMVGGGFGHFYSGQVSVVIFLLSFFLLRRRIDPAHFLNSLNENKIYVLLLLPTFLNETKVSFVMLALYFALLAPIDRKLLLRMAVIGPVVALMLWAGLSIYDYTTTQSGNATAFATTEERIAYFMVESVENAEGGARWDIENNRGVTDVPRFTKLMYTVLLNEQEPGHVLIGFGVGQFKGGTQVEQSDFARTYDWLLMGSIPYLFHIYIQMGLIGLAMLLAYGIFIAVKRPQWAPHRDLNLQLMLLAVVLLVCFYNDMLRNLAFCMLFFTLMATSWRINDDC